MSSMKLLIIGGTFAALTVWSVAVISSRDTDSSDAQNEWTLVWSDEFNEQELDPKKWSPETSCWGGGNNERQCYTDRPDNINVSDGVLKLTAKAEPFTSLKYPQDWPDRGEKITQSYTSGKVRTKGLAHWKYGRFEARIKLPQGQSTWPAFWMMPEYNRYGEWPLSGEIDIMEAVNLGAKCNNCVGSKSENRSSGALHFGDSWPKNKFYTQKHVLPDGLNAYHIFSVEWSEGQIDWFVNQQKIFTMTENDWFTGDVPKTKSPFAPFDQPFYLALNLAVGGDLPDNRNEKAFNSNSFPNELLVDWVRVYQCEGDIETSKKCLSVPH